MPLQFQSIFTFQSKGLKQFSWNDTILCAIQSAKCQKVLSWWMGDFPPQPQSLLNCKPDSPHGPPQREVQRLPLAPGNVVLPGGDSADGHGLIRPGRQAPKELQGGAGRRGGQEEVLQGVSL